MDCKVTEISREDFKIINIIYIKTLSINFKLSLPLCSNKNLYL